MGGWKLEVFKISFYLTFPIATFWAFNQPEFFEDWVIKKRREIYPPRDNTKTEMMQALREQSEKRRQEALEREWKAATPVTNVKDGQV